MLLYCTNIWHCFGKNKKLKYQARQSRLGGTAWQWLLYPTLSFFLYVLTSVEDIRRRLRKKEKVILSQYVEILGNTGVTVYLAPLGSLPPGGEDTPGFLAPRPGYLHPRGARYPSRGILPPIQNILSIKSFFLFSYVKTYYFYHIRFIIMMMTRVHSCKTNHFKYMILRGGGEDTLAWVSCPPPSFVLMSS